MSHVQSACIVSKQTSSTSLILQSSSESITLRWTTGQLLQTHAGRPCHFHSDRVCVWTTAKHPGQLLSACKPIRHPAQQKGVRVCVGVTNRVINFHASHCQNCLLIQGARSEMSLGKLSQRPWPHIRHSPNFQHTLLDNERGRGPPPFSCCDGQGELAQ